jgi:hypothetical protein
MALGEAPEAFMLRTVFAAYFIVRSAFRPSWSSRPSFSRTDAVREERGAKAFRASSAARSSSSERLLLIC